MKVKGPTIAQLVTSTWGWLLVALFLCLTLAMGVYWHHPFYESVGGELSTLQEFLPLLMAGILWTLMVAVVVLLAVRRGRRHKLESGDLSHLKVANWCFLALSAVFSLFMPGAIGAGLATFVNSCLLIMCLVYVAVTIGVTGRVEPADVFCTCGVVLSIVVCWI